MSDDDSLPDDLTFVDAAGDWVDVACPYCGEGQSILLDAETEGELVQDCEVCCQPWQLRVRRDAEGGVEVDVGVL